MAAPAMQVEVQDPEGHVKRASLTTPRAVIGRSSEAQVLLESQSVSRKHAELYKDPFDRWWVRDLGSRNGTYVNGRKVSERVVHGGDVIQIEDFTLTLRTPSLTVEQSTHRTTVNLTLADARDQNVRSLSDFEKPRLDAAHLSRLAELSGQLLLTEDRTGRLGLLCSLLVSRDFHGRHAVAMRLGRLTTEKIDPEPLCEPLRAEGEPEESSYISRTVLRSVLTTGSAVVAGKSSPGGSSTAMVEMSLDGAMPGAASSSAIACPLASDDEFMDIVYVSLPQSFGTGEWLSLVALAAEAFAQSDAAWTARQQAQASAVIEKELDRARAIQMRLVPRDASIAGVDMEIGFEPCRWVGGDYADVLDLGDGRVLLAVADVCGKGLQAALIAASLHSTVHTNAPGLPLLDLVTRLNNYLCDSIPDESFVTMIVLMLDPRTGAYTCINAGHPPALVVTQDKRIETLQSAQNAPLGIMPIDFIVQSGTLDAGRVLALYTDGLSELANADGRMLGVPGLSLILGQLDPGKPCAELAARLGQSLDDYAANTVAQDDRTFLLLRRMA